VHVGCACGVRGTLRKPGSSLHACVIQSCVLFNCNPNGGLVVSPPATIGAADSQMVEVAKQTQVCIHIQSNMAAANQAQAPRQTGCDSEAEWNSTHKCMPHIGSFDNIGTDDLVGDNSIVIITTFPKKLADAEDSRHAKRPCSTTTLTNTLNACIHRLRVKFRNESQNLPNFFPDDHVKKWRIIVKDGRNHNATQGDKESDLFRNTLPMPRQPSLRTVLFFEDDMRDPKDCLTSFPMQPNCRLPSIQQQA